MNLSNQLQIDSLHCRTILTRLESGCRPSFAPTRPICPSDLGPIDRLADQDRELDPSIVPDLDDMIWQPATVSHAP